MIKKTLIKGFLFVYIFISFIPVASAVSIQRGRVTGSNVNVRRGPGTTHAAITTRTNQVVRMPNHTIHRSQSGCPAGWYQVYYDNDINNIGYVCADHFTTNLTGWVDPWDRPWNTPKKSIIGGARFIANSYIGRGQFTTYLQKFNVSTESDRAAHTNQYMTNIMAPYSEAQTTFNAYNANGLINRALTFSIPVFDDMPAETNLAGYSRSNNGTSTPASPDFEAHLTAQGFPEEYKSRLRVLHQKYPHWRFEAMHTRLNWNDSVTRQRNVGAIQATSTSSVNWQHREGNPIEGSTWYRPTINATAYFLDPRNFLDEVRIMQFLRLNFSDIFTEADVQVVLQPGFMRGISVLDNQTYASIFMEAGRVANVNPVHLASRARLEVGNNLGRASSGEAFTFRGITYSGLYNFYNIGALSSEPVSPASLGVVWASGALCERCEGEHTPSTPGTPTFIRGDVTGTGTVDIADIVAIRQHILGIRPLSGNPLLAADVNNDGQVDVADIVAIRQHLTGQRSIVQ